MKLLELHTNLSKVDLQSLRWITISLFLVLIHQTFSSLLFQSSLLLVISLSIIAFGVGGCYIFISRHRLAKYPQLFLFLIFYFVIIGFVQGFGNLPIVINQDIRYVILFLMGGIFSYNSETMSYFHWLMKWLGIISVAFGIMGLLSFDITAVAISERAGTWTMSYYYWWASCACFSYWGYYAFFTKKQKLIGFSVLLVYLILGALFVKRASLVNGLVILVVFLLFDRGVKLRTSLKVLFIAISTVALLYLVAPAAFVAITDSYTARIEQIREDPEELDRNREANAYFENATNGQLLFGNGIGHYIDYYGSINKESITLNALHIGWANVLYKGGVIYALFYLAILLLVVRKCFNSRKLNQYQLTCLGVSISSFVSLLYEGSWTSTLLPVCISAPLFYLLSNNDNEVV